MHLRNLSHLLACQLGCSKTLLVYITTGFCQFEPEHLPYRQFGSNKTLLVCNATSPYEFEPKHLPYMLARQLGCNKTLPV
eukprot:1141190-Pelagomonas_calceolata.AAC.5